MNFKSYFCESLTFETSATALNLFETMLDGARAGVYIAFTLNITIYIMFNLEKKCRKTRMQKKR